MPNGFDHVSFWAGNVMYKSWEILRNIVVHGHANHSKQIGTLDVATFFYSYNAITHNTANYEYFILQVVGNHQFLYDFWWFLKISGNTYFAHILYVSDPYRTRTGPVPRNRTVIVRKRGVDMRTKIRAIYVFWPYLVYSQSWEILDDFGIFTSISWYFLDLVPCCSTRCHMFPSCCGPISQSDCCSGLHIVWLRSCLAVLGVIMAPKSSAAKQQPRSVQSKTFSCSELKEGEQQLKKVKQEGISPEDLQRQIKESQLWSVFSSVAVIDVVLVSSCRELCWPIASQSVFVDLMHDVVRNRDSYIDNIMAMKPDNWCSRYTLIFNLHMLPVGVCELVTPSI